MNSTKIHVCAQLVLLAGLTVFSPVVMSRPLPAQDAQAAPDNTKQNKDQSSPNADQQKMNSSDRTMTQQIRKSIMADKSLSTYGHNVKIITQNGKVTLRGPVRSEDEKSNIEAKAVAVAGQDNVTSQLQVAASK